MLPVPPPPALPLARRTRWRTLDRYSSLQCRAAALLSLSGSCSPPSPFSASIPLHPPPLPLLPAPHRPPPRPPRPPRSPSPARWRMGPLRHRDGGLSGSCSPPSPFSAAIPLHPPPLPLLPAPHRPPPRRSPPSPFSASIPLHPPPLPLLPASHRPPPRPLRSPSPARLRMGPLRHRVDDAGTRQETAATPRRHFRTTFGATEVMRRSGAAKPTRSPPSTSTSTTTRRPTRARSHQRTRRSLLSLSNGRRRTRGGPPLRLRRSRRLPPPLRPRRPPRYPLPAPALASSTPSYLVELRQDGIQMTKHTYMALINAYSRLGNFDMAKQVLLDEEIPPKYLNEIKSVLVGALASNGWVSDGLNMYDEIKQSGCCLEPKATIALIEHIQTKGELDRLYQLLEELNDSSSWFDGCSRVLLYCVQHNHPDAAVDLLRQPKEKD